MDYSTVLVNSRERWVMNYRAKFINQSGHLQEAQPNLCSLSSITIHMLILTCHRHVFVLATTFLWQHCQAKHGMTVVNVKPTNEPIIVVQHSFSGHVGWGESACQHGRLGSLVVNPASMLTLTLDSRQSQKHFGFYTWIRKDNLPCCTYLDPDRPLHAIILADITWLVFMYYRQCTCGLKSLTLSPL